MVRIVCVLMILHIFHSPFFQLNCYFRAITWSMISQPTDGFLPRHRRRPLACTTTEQPRKKNGENTSCYDDFTVCLLTFFSIKLLCSCYLAISDIAAHSWIFAPPPPPSARVYYNRAATQKESWECIAFRQFYSLFTHLFFNLIAIFVSSRDQWYRSPIAGFLPRCRRRPLAFIAIERRRKKNGKNRLCFDNFTVCLLTFFPIKLLFSGLSRDLWYPSRQMDFCSAAAAVSSRL